MDLKSLVENEKPIAQLEQFIPDFMNDRLSEMKDLIKYRNNKSYEHILAVVHKWKGFSEPYGFAHLAVISAELEQQIKLKDEEQISRLVSELSSYLDAKEAYLKTK